MRDYIKEIGEGLLCKPSLSYDKRLWLKYKPAISSAIYLVFCVHKGRQGKGGKMDLIKLTIPYHTHVINSFLSQSISMQYLALVMSLRTLY